MASFTRRNFLAAAFGASAGALVMQRSMLPRPQRGPTPTIGISIDPAFRSQVPKPKELIKLFEAYTEVLEPHWGVSARFVALDYPVSSAGIWNMIFAEDDLEDEGALAYHDFDPAKSAYPYALIEVPASLADEGNVTGAATHELVEMLCDPGCGYWADAAPLSDEDVHSTSAMRAAKLMGYETADPVQNCPFKLRGHPVSDFVFPAYFDWWTEEQGPMDYLGAITHPHQIAKGGYQIMRDGNHTYQVVNVGFGPVERETGIQNDKTDETWRCHRFRRILRKCQAPQSSSGVGPQT
jgi:hypothetical protein